MRTIGKLVLILSLLFCCAAASAQNVKFEVNGPPVVAAGRPFRIEFAINVKPDKFDLPDIEGFDVLAGPSVSTMHNWSMSSDGDMEQSQTYAYTYVVMASEQGTYSIPPATATVKGKEHRTRALPIQVVNEEQSSSGNAARPPAPGAQGGTQQQQQRQQPPATETIKADDIVLAVVPDKTSVYKGEAVRVLVKLYYKVPIVGLQDWKLPAFNGFWAQQLSVDHYQTRRETFNGKVYDSDVIAEYLIYPQQSGTLQIEQTDVTAVAQVVVQSQRRSLLDEFLGGMPDIKQVGRKLSSQPISIEIKPWPAGAPESFGGAVGTFTMTTDFPTEPIAANASASYLLKISGTGNLPLIQAPALTIPQSFEQYNIKATESLQRSAAGISGYRQFEYPVIARAAGRYFIDPARFSYFDPQQERYVTLSAPEREVEVLADSAAARTASGTIVSGLTKGDVEILSQDIRFIKLSAPGLSLRRAPLMGSWWYFGTLAFIAAAFFALLTYLRRRAEQRCNVVAVKGKRANKVALQRLRAAESYMTQGNQRGFYEEMLRALWGYMGDKLNIPAANLTKESVRESLVRNGVTEELAARCIDLVTDCEYAQYAPSGSGQMQEIYRNGLELISKIEPMIKR